jgi:hypothetical protein
VTSPTATEITTAQGPVHTGTGDLRVENQYYIPNSLADPKGRTPHRQVVDDLNELDRRFVPPRGLAEAREVLASHQAVFLQAPRGSGRPTTAKMLLKELAATEDTILQIWVQDKTREAATPFDFTYIGEGDYTWVDLTDTGGWSWDEVQSELPALRSMARRKKAHLVVILPDEGARLATDILHLRVRLAPPPVAEVLRKHFRAAGFEQLELRQTDGLEFARTDRPLRDVPEYVQLVEEARDLAAGDGDFKAWCGIALDAFKGRMSEASEFIRMLTDGPKRALLFSVAMLHGAHGDAIDYATAALMDRAKHVGGPDLVLEHTALDIRLTDVNAKADTHGNVHFKVLGLDAAVRSYFWTQLPSLRGPITAWLPITLDSHDLDQAERDNLVTNFASLCLTERYHMVLPELIQQFTGRYATVARVDAAALILRHGLRDERLAREFRRQIYAWSTSHNTSDQLTAVLVSACRDEIFATHPDEAMVRLHHLARRSRYGRGSKAHEALVSLVRSDPRSMRQMLTRIADPPQEARPWRADSLLFLDIAHPWTLTALGDRGGPLLTEDLVAQQLSKGWALVFTDLPGESWANYGEDWLSCAADSAQYQDALLNILVRGARGNPDTLASLYEIAFDSDFRDTVSGPLLRKITHAQGVVLP